MLKAEAQFSTTLVPSTKAGTIKMIYIGLYSILALYIVVYIDCVPFNVRNTREIISSLLFIKC